MERYVDHYYQGDADLTHYNTIRERQSAITNLKRKYANAKCGQDNDKDDHDDWMNGGGGMFVNMMEVVPPPEWQVDNSDNPHGPGPKKPHRNTIASPDQQTVQSVGSTGWTALWAAIGIYLLSNAAKVVIEY